MKTFDSLAIIGGAHMDLTGNLFAPPVAGRSNPGKLTRRPGGVGLNTARVATMLGLATAIAGPVGADGDAETLRALLAEKGIGDGLVALEGARTGTFVSIIAPDGEMVIGLADLGIYESVDAKWFLANCADVLEPAAAWFLTSNQDIATLEGLCRAAGEKRFVVAATVSAAKAARLFSILERIDLLAGNLGEARVLADMPGAEGEELARFFMAHRVGAGFISSAEEPLTWWQDGEMGRLVPPPLTHIADVNGAGDALAGTVLAGLARGLKLERAASLGMVAAQLTLGVPEPVHPGLDWATLEAGCGDVAPGADPA